MSDEPLKVSHAVLDTGRIRLPSGFAQPGERVVVTVYPDPSLLVFKEDAWERLRARLLEVYEQRTGPDKQFAQLLVGYAGDTVVGARRRITISKPLLEISGIKGNTRIEQSESRLKLSRA